MASQISIAEAYGKNLKKRILPLAYQTRVSDEIYAVYFEYEGDHTQPFSYFIGCKVTDSAPAPDMDTLTIPAQSYTKFIAKGKMPDCISNSWKDIWDSKIERAYKYDFEDL